MHHWGKTRKGCYEQETVWDKKELLKIKNVFAQIRIVVAVRFEDDAEEISQV